MKTRYINKLKSISSPISLLDIDENLKEALMQFGNNGLELMHFLDKCNGAYAFESALHFFSAAQDIQEISIAKWNSTEYWRSDYGSLNPSGYFFAEDIFGGQFFINNEGFFSFDPETGEVEKISVTFEHWCKEILDDYDYYTGHSLAHEWQLMHGKIPPGNRLLPKKPFVLGGEYDLENLYISESLKGMKARASIAIQLQKFPDGSTVNINYGN